MNTLMSEIKKYGTKEIHTYTTNERAKGRNNDGRNK